MRLSVLAALLALAACGPSPRPAANRTIVTDPNAADPTSEVVCQEERTTGTNMSRQRCLTKEQIDENRRAAMEWETKVKNTPTSVK